MEKSAITSSVDAARCRLGLDGARARIQERAALVCGAASVCAALRPLVWPEHGEPPPAAVLRALLLAVSGAATVLAIVAVRAWRGRPSTLLSARALDHALGREEEIASAFAFERDGRADAMARYVVDRAARVLDGVAVDRVLAPVARVRPRPAVLGGAALGVVLGLTIGSLDRITIERLAHPVTERETVAASELTRAAEAAAAASPPEAKTPAARELVDAARRAEEATKRGDRSGAGEALEAVRKAARSLENDERARGRSLREVRDAIEGARSGTSGGRPSATAAEALERLARELEAAGAEGESARHVLERLERAERAAREAATRGATGARAGSSSAEWSRAAKALEEAREAAARGDKSAASEALARAKREISGMEKASAEASKGGALARIAEGASELDRSMHAARSGEPRGGARPGEGGSGDRGERGEGAGRSNAGTRSGSEASGQPGTGPGQGDRRPGPEARRLKVDGDLQARTDVRAGERAVSVIEGMGRGDEPRAYREIFPAYDTVVEDGLREDHVPAARRPTVRRYFSSIRPSAEESRKTP